MPAATPNLRGLFAGDWATDTKITLLAESFTIFSSLQKIADEESARQNGGSSATAGPSSLRTLGGLLPPVQTLQYYHRISNLYRDALRRFIESTTKGLVDDDEDDDDDSGRQDAKLAQSLHTIFYFAEMLYVPSDGRGAGVVGEEIVHWLNSFDSAPHSDDGQEIAQSARPYEHPSYWDYTLRCVLRGFNTTAASLLSHLAKSHPAPTLRRVALRVCELLSSMPRSTAFSLEHDFIAAHRRWVGQARSVLNKLELDMDEMEAELAGTIAEDGVDDGIQRQQEERSPDEIEDERLEYEAQFRCLLELMIGVKERIFEASDDWREALGAWGILVQPALKRDDVPEVIHAILETFPIDATVVSEAILVALAEGNVMHACTLAHDCDPWLAAHLTDLLDRVGILEEEDVMDEGTTSTAKAMRTSYIEQYAETLLDDQGLWRLAVDYLAFCGNTARHRMRHILLDVPLTGPDVRPSRTDAKRAEEIEAEAEDAEMDEEDDDPEAAAEARRSLKQKEREDKRVADEFKAAMEIIQTCLDLGMDLEARAVCKRMATEMARQKRVGPALAYCVRARDVRQIKRIADEILDLYINAGAEVFCKAVDSIPFSLLRKATDRAEGEDPTESFLAAGAKNDGNEKEVAQTFEDFIAKDRGSVYSSRLVFLSRYRDFHRLYAEGSMRPAAALLVELLTSNVAPERFWAILLVDAVPFLQGDLLTAEESFELLRVLDLVTSASLTHPRQAYHYLGLLEALLSPTKQTEKAKSLKKTSGKKLLNGNARHGHSEAEEGGDEEDEAWESGQKSFDARGATRRLDVLRLALARHLARSVVS